MSRPSDGAGAPWHDCHCGLTHPHGCRAHSHRGTQPCGGMAVTGLTVCVAHGARTPTSIAKTERAKTERRTRALVRATLAEAYGDQVPHIDPADAMLQAVAWKYAEVLALRSKVAELDDKDRVWGKTRRKTGGDDAGTTREAKPNVWWTELQRAEEQLVRFAKACRDARVDEAKVLLAKRQGDMVANVIKGILDALALTPKQLELVPVVVPAQLRLLTATPSTIGA